MIELTENILQLFAALFGFCISIMRFYRTRSQPYFLLTCFYGCFALGSLYWTLYLLLFSKTPQVFYVSEFGWVSSVIFLRILQYELSDAQERAFKCRAMWLAPLIGVPLCALYCVYGDVLSNLIWCGLVICISYCSIRGLVYAKRAESRRDTRRFHIMVLFFSAVEYCLWTSGCFWQGDSLLNPYFWFDILLTGSILGFLPAAGKAVKS